MLLERPFVTKSFDIFGIKVNASTYEESINLIKSLTLRHVPSYICILNVHVAVTAATNEDFKKIINHSNCVFSDGVPIVWYAKRVINIKQANRITGPSLMDRCFDELRDLKHFLFGSTKETLCRIERLCNSKYPNINIVGKYSPPFKSLNEQENRKIINIINDVSPDIIWVGLGAPKQEIWMNEIKCGLNKGVMIGVGAAFDYFAGNIQRPPIWLRRLGVEWLCRLLQEPTRLWKRYLFTNSIFIFLVFKEILSGFTNFKGKGTDIDAEK